MSKVKKSTHSLDTEELLGILETDETPQGEAEIVYKNDMLTFISTFALEAGENKIKQHTLYNIYKAWSKDPVKKSEFILEMANIFDTTQAKTSTCYLLNSSAIKLTHDAYKYYTNEATVRPTSKIWKQHFENFLKFHSLTPGPYWVHANILYFIYDKYCHATGLDRSSKTYMGKATFFLYCSTYLERKKYGRKGRYYGISDNIKSFFQIDQLQRMEAQYAQTNQAKPKKARRPRRQRKSKD